MSYMSRRYLSGFHARIVQGDSLQAQAYQALQKADILITDPPYCLLQRKRINGDLRDHKRQQKLDGREEVPRFVDLREYRTFTKKWIESTLLHGLKPQAPLIIWTNFLGKSVINEVLRSFQYESIGDFAWLKVSSGQEKDQSQPWNSSKSEVLLRSYEIAGIYQHQEVLKHNQHQIGVDEVMIHGQCIKRAAIPWSVCSGYHDPSATSSSTSPRLNTNSDKSDVNHSQIKTVATTNLLTKNDSISSPKSDGKLFQAHDHPCHKPLAVLLPLIHTWMAEDSIALDPFAGSGGIGKAIQAAGGNRQYQGIEKLPVWASYLEKEL